MPATQSTDSSTHILKKPRLHRMFVLIPCCTESIAKPLTMWMGGSGGPFGRPGLSRRRALRLHLATCCVLSIISVTIAVASMVAIKASRPAVA